MSYRIWLLGAMLALFAACGANDVGDNGVSVVQQAQCIPPDDGSSGHVCGNPGSPIIIDTTGNGFNLTTAASGVPFDLDGGHSGQLLSWTTFGASGDGWLALDRDGDGRITWGGELFGNFTEQLSIDPATRNGYLALAMFDENHDGKIDSRDSVFASLRVWVDANHNGVSEVSELKTLATLGITSISTSYVENKYTDANGNEFRYRGSLTKTPTSSVSTTTYDVFLTMYNPNWQRDPHQLCCYSSFHYEWKCQALCYEAPQWGTAEGLWQFCGYPSNPNSVTWNDWRLEDPWGEMHFAFLPGMFASWAIGFGNWQLTGLAAQQDSRSQCWGQVLTNPCYLCDLYGNFLNQTNPGESNIYQNPCSFRKVYD